MMAVAFPRGVPVKLCLRWMAALAIIAGLSDVLAQQNWIVKPEWVTAHEYFLSSDVLAGRGSATRDEELAATYIASEFESYGLNPAPGMSSYLQTAEVIAPKLDGHASLQTGDASLQEGSDFALLSSSGASVTGPLVHVAFSDLQTTHVAEGSAVLLIGGVDQKGIFPAMSALRHQGAVIVLVPETPA